MLTNQYTAPFVNGNVCHNIQNNKTVRIANYMPCVANLVLVQEVEHGISTDVIYVCNEAHLVKKTD